MVALRRASSLRGRGQAALAYKAMGRTFPKTARSRLAVVVGSPTSLLATSQALVSLAVAAGATALAATET
eukprot:13057019-Alexandrium_andersonii.AAC.1